MNLKALTKTARRTLSRNSSKILLGLGIAGAFTAVGFAISATPKAMILLEEKSRSWGREAGRQDHHQDGSTGIHTHSHLYGHLDRLHHRSEQRQRPEKRCAGGSLHHVGDGSAELSGQGRGDGRAGEGEGD